MTTSSNGNISHVTGHLRGEFTGHRWIPRTKASDAELWCLIFNTGIAIPAKTVFILRRGPDVNADWYYRTVCDMYTQKSRLMVRP